MINRFITNKFAQVQLENSRYIEPSQIESNSKSFRVQNIRNESPIINYELSEVKQNIYDAVSRKKHLVGHHQKVKPYYDNNGTDNRSRLNMNRSTVSYQANKSMDNLIS